MFGSSSLVAFFLIFLIGSSIKLFSIFQQYKFIRKNGCKPEPKIRQNPLLVGFDMSYQCLKWAQADAYLQEYNRLFAKIGKTFTVRVTGVRKLKSICPENSRYVLGSRDGEWEKGHVLREALQPAIGKGILGAGGPTWAKGRALIRPAFARKQITDLESYEDHFQELLARIPKDGTTVDLKPLFHHFTFDTSSRLLLGKSPHTLRPDASPEALAVEDSFDFVQGQMIDRMLRGPLMFTYKNQKFSEACEKLHKYFDSYISQAVRISSLAASKEVWEREMPGTGDRFVLLREAVKSTSDRVFLRDQLISALVGGRDTTASIMSLIVLLLAKDKKVTQKLRNEVDELQGAIPTFETFKSMPYLEAVINEGLRLYPVVPQIDREAHRDTFLPTGGGPDKMSPIFVPKGRTIQISIYGMHRDPDIWGPDCNEFIPERWEKLPKSPSGYMPFGASGHICPGQQIAMAGTSFMIVRLLQSFKRIEDRDGGDIVEDLGVSMGSKNGSLLGLYVN